MAFLRRLYNLQEVPSNDSHSRTAERQEHTFNDYDWHSVVEGLEEKLHLVLVVPHHRVECLEERQGRSVATANSLKLARQKRLSYEASRCALNAWCLNWHDDTTMAYKAP